MSLLLTILASASAWSQGQELRYKFQVGDKNSYITEQKQEMKLPINGQETELRINLLFETTQTVESVETAAGTARLKLKYDRVKMTIDGPITMEYDSNSDKEPDGPLASTAGVFKAMKDSDIKLTMNTRGEITEMKMPDSLIEELKKQSGGNSDTFGNMFSEDALKNMAKQGSITLPEEVPVPMKTTWQRNLDMKLGQIGTLKNLTKYTYQGKSDNFDKIDMKMDMKLEVNPNSTTPMSMKTKEANGTTLFDNAKGRVHEMTMKSISEVEMGPIGTANVVQTTTMKLK